MAEATNTTRRSLFAISAGLALSPAFQVSSAQPDDWATLRRTLAFIHPAFDELARRAERDGRRIADCTMISRPANGSPPFLMFRGTTADAALHSYGLPTQRRTAGEIVRSRAA